MIYSNLYIDLIFFKYSKMNSTAFGMPIVLDTNSIITIVLLVCLISVVPTIWFCWCCAVFFTRYFNSYGNFQNLSMFGTSKEYKIKGLFECCFGSIGSPKLTNIIVVSMANIGSPNISNQIAAQE